MRVLQHALPVALATVLVAVSFGAASAQEAPSAVPDPWLQKLRAACSGPAPEPCSQSGVGLVLNPEETQALFDRLVELENARVLDVSFSDTRVYVIAVDGRVLATVTRPDHHEE